MADEILSGHTVYDRSGLEYEFCEKLKGDRALVRPILTIYGYEGEESAPSEAPSILPFSSLSRTKPVQAIDAEIADAAERLKAIEAKIREAESSLLSTHKSITDRVAKLQKFSGLERLEEYLDGAITHFVVKKQYYSSVDVMTFEEFATCTDDRGRTTGELKLLCLFGTTKD